MTNLYNLSWINAGLQCFNQYLTDVKDENKKSTAASNLGQNIFASGFRIGMAENMYRYTGNPMYHGFNNMMSYTDPNVNAYTTNYAMMSIFNPMSMYGGFYAPPPPRPMGGGGGTTIKIFC